MKYQSFVAPNSELYDRLSRSGPVQLTRTRMRLTGPDEIVDSATLVPFPNPAS